MTDTSPVAAKPQTLVWSNPWHNLAFGFGSGLMPKAPGTWGSLVALPFVPLWQLLPAWGYGLMLVVTTLFLFKQQLLPSWMHWAAALLIIWWVMHMGLLMERHRRAVMLESGRIMAFALLGIGLAPALLNAWPLITIVLGGVSLLHLAMLAAKDILPW